MMYVFISVYVLRCKLTILELVSYRRGITDPCRLCIKDVPCNVHHQLLYETLRSAKAMCKWVCVIGCHCIITREYIRSHLLYRSPTAIGNVSVTYVSRNQI